MQIEPKTNLKWPELFVRLMDFSTTVSAMETSISHHLDMPHPRLKVHQVTWEYVYIAHCECINDIVDLWNCWNVVDTFGMMYPVGVHI